MRTNLIPIITAGLVLIAAAPVFAQSHVPSADAPPSVKIVFADLDLNSREGAAAALRRIERAAVTVCGDEPDIRQLDRQAAFESCRREAVTGAVKSLDRPLVSRAAAAEPAPVMVATR